MKFHLPQIHVKTPQGLNSMILLWSFGHDLLKIIFLTILFKSLAYALLIFLEFLVVFAFLSSSINGRCTYQLGESCISFSIVRTALKSSSLFVVLRNHNRSSLYNSWPIHFHMIWILSHYDLISTAFLISWASKHIKVTMPQRFLFPQTSRCSHDWLFVGCM